jgi:hypothetical protein
VSGEVLRRLDAGNRLLARADREVLDHDRRRGRRAVGNDRGRRGTYKML